MKTRNTRSANRLPQRTAIASAVMLAFVTPAALAQYKPNVEVYVKPGSERNYLGVDGLVPLVENGTSLFFADAKAHMITESSANEVNLGLGYRALTADQQWAWGVYGAFDYKNTKYDNHFNQITVGAELRSREWDFRSNYYQILTDKKFVGLGATNHFAGNGVWRNGVYEEGLSGFDVEVGRLLDISDRYDVRAYLAGYSFKSKEFGAHDDGVRARLEIRPQKNFSLGVSLQHDSLFGSVGFVEMRYAFGQSSESGPRTLGERMTDPWKRDQDIVTSGAMESEKSGDSVKTADSAVHINSNAAAGGDGSYERPYQSVGRCQDGVEGGVDDKCHETVGESNVGRYNLIRLWQGDSLVNHYFPVTLKDGQTLWGQGVDLYSGRTQSGLYPVIDSGLASAQAGGPGADPGPSVQVYDSSSATGVMLASGGTLGNTVTGVKIIGTENGISGVNTWGNVKLDRNIIDVDGYGISLQNDSGRKRFAVQKEVGRESFSQTVSITGNEIKTSKRSYSGYGGYSGYGSDGIYLDNGFDGDVDFNQAVTISGNRITAAGNGIYLDNYAGSGSHLSQTALISGNSLVQGAYDGVHLDSYAWEGIIRQTVEVSGNTIVADHDGIYVGSDSDGESDRAQSVTIANNNITFGERGIHATNYAWGLDDLSVQALTISGNAITAGSDMDRLKSEKPGYGRNSGILLENRAGSAGGAVQTATISGNTITAIGGVSAINFADADKYLTGVANQTLTISGNTIKAAKYGILLDNSAGADHVTKAGTATQTATISGNALSSLSGFGPAGIFARNSDDDKHDAKQLVTVSGSNSVTGFKYGLMAFSNGDHPASQQTVAVSGLSVTSPALAGPLPGAAIAKCHSGVAAQSVSAGSGNTLNGAQVKTVTESRVCTDK